MIAKVLSDPRLGGHSHGKWPHEEEHHVGPDAGASSAPEPEWREKLGAAVDEITDKLQIAFRLSHLENTINELAQGANGFQTVIRSLSPHNGTLRRDMHVVVRPVDSDWVASFFDGNVHASGQTEIEAIDNLKSMLLDYFEELSELPHEALGVEMRRCYDVLSEYIEVAHGAKQG